MNVMKGIALLLVAMAVAVGVDMACEGKVEKYMYGPITAPADIEALFPKSSAEIGRRIDVALAHAHDALAKMIAITDAQRTFANTAKALDAVSALSELTVTARVTQILEMVSPDESIRTAAHAGIQKIDEFVVDNLSNNVEVYNAFKAYVEGNAQHEQLTAEQQRYLTETMKDFVRRGLNLPQEKRAQVKSLQKELAKLSQDFAQNIAQDNRTITVSLQGLQGLEQDFIAALKKTEDGLYILGVDYPTYFNVMENCWVEDTRKQLYMAFQNRAYPANEPLLKAVIAKRDELAQLLGFDDYVQLDLDNSMVATEERAQAFLNEILKRSTVKADQEFAQMTHELPQGVALDQEGKIAPWSWAFVKASYKKKNFALDERDIAQYFPMENTIKELLDIYHQFLNINFKEMPISGLWHQDVKLIQVSTGNDDIVLGYLLLDLYPRENKYSHACEIGIIPAVYGEHNATPPALALVIANFPKSTATKPSLLKRDDVETFFHEFGHALHELLGRTHIASLAGTEVKRDFVEMPSQMLEEWLWDHDMLKKVSHHYITGEPLSDELIAKIQQLKNFDSGDWVQRQAYLAKLSLACFGKGATKDPYAIMHTLQHTLRPHISNEPNDHMYASFGHLMGYGAQYYGYLWSKVYALDLFNEIKKYGLLNPVIGKKYITDVIGCGGTQDPNDLLHNFLGREPNSDAFFADLGI